MKMRYHVRLMCREDVAQVTEIDRLCFPGTWPPPNYRHELENRLAHYVVASDADKRETRVEAIPERRFSGLASRLRRLFNRDLFLEDEARALVNEYIVGFAGFWIMADEAHLINIAMREEYRRQGIGELLLMSIIDLATELNTNIITLEVRISNLAAQNLYSKYGFAKIGVRTGYYTDNREDAQLMTLENLTSASFQARLQQLKQAHAERWGVTNTRLSASHISAK